jgi:hypothetical protein
MRWFRASKQASLLAFAALALQFVVSFGHVHLDGIRRADSAVSALGPRAQVATSLPAQPSDTDDDYCAICASIYLAANSFVSQPPQLAVPSASHGVEHFDRTVVDFIAPRRPPFQSRAPPLA